jgi:glutamine amidotransferase class-I domain protein
VRMAKSMGLPMLGICRGTQLTNVALGGSLCQDISLFCEHPLLHTQRHSADAPLHQVALQSGSRLSCLFGAETVFTNSTHHQCVDMPAPGLKITARTSDGVPEGLESDDGQVVLVQWHPETLCRTDARMLRLFEDLVGRARAYSDAHPMR